MAVMEAEVAPWYLPPRIIIVFSSVQAGHICVRRAIVILTPPVITVALYINTDIYVITTIPVQQLMIPLFLIVVRVIIVLVLPVLAARVSLRHPLVMVPANVM